MPALTPLPLPPRFASLTEAADGLEALEHALRKRQDRRAIFTSAYLNITRAIAQALEAGTFRDGAWTTRYTIAFANLYRSALLAYEQGDIAAVPKSWRIAFATACGGRALVIQDLVLGINAHINHDLALALVEIGIDPDRAARYADHCTVNQVLHTAVDPMQERVGRLYAPILNLLDRGCERLDEEIACFSVAKARESAWTTALALTNARDESERAAIRTSLDDRSAVLARLILAPTFAQPWVVAALQHLETINPWTQWLGRTR